MGNIGVKAELRDGLHRDRLKALEHRLVGVPGSLSRRRPDAENDECTKERRALTTRLLVDITRKDVIRTQSRLLLATRNVSIKTNKDKKRPYTLPRLVQYRKRLDWILYTY